MVWTCLAREFMLASVAASFAGASLVYIDYVNGYYRTWARQGHRRSSVDSYLVYVFSLFNLLAREFTAHVRAGVSTVGDHGAAACLTPPTFTATSCSTEPLSEINDYIANGYFGVTPRTCCSAVVFVLYWTVLIILP